MTEAEWLACEDPDELLIVVQCTAEIRVSERRVRLLACAWCRLMWHKLIDLRVRSVVEVAERYADGLVTHEYLRTVQKAAKVDRVTSFNWEELERLPSAEQVDLLSTCAAIEVGYAENGWDFFDHARSVLDLTLQFAGREGAGSNGNETRALSVCLLRDIFGNPFRPVAFAPSWHTDAAFTLARRMYDSRDFSAMPILADALQDAGCDSEDILDHCRGPGPHVRGCWVVDLVLGKE